MSEELRNWARDNDRTGVFIDDAEGQVVRATGGITSKMNARLAREAAEVLGLDMEDVRSMSCDDLAAQLSKHYNC